MWELEKVAVLPKEILDCDHVARALEFSSERAIADLRLVQRMVMLGEEVESEAGAPRHSSLRAARSAIPAPRCLQRKLQPAGLACLRFAPQQ